MTEGSLYEFKITAVNLAGIGQPSDPSELFKCEAWTMPEPGKSPLPDRGAALCGMRSRAPELVGILSAHARASHPVPGTGRRCG